MDCSTPASSVHGDSPGKNTGVGCHASARGSSQPRDQTHVSYVSCIDRQVFFTTSVPGKTLPVVTGKNYWAATGCQAWFKCILYVCVYVCVYIHMYIYWTLTHSTITITLLDQFSSVASDSLWPHGLQFARLPGLSPTPGACSSSCPPSWWCHPTISSASLPAFSLSQQSGSFPMSQFFTLGGQSIGVSASVFPMNIQDWFPLGLTDLISLQSKGLSRVFSNTTVQKHQFFSVQLSLWFNSPYWIIIVSPTLHQENWNQPVVDCIMPLPSHRDK